MSHFIRKHKSVFLWTAVILIGVPMVGFGVPWSALFGGRGPGGPGQQPIAVAAGVPISEAQLRQAVNQRFDENQADVEAQYKEMLADGTVESILNQLIAQALYEARIQQVDVDLDREYLTELLKQQPQFNTESGEFLVRRWNDFVESQADWDRVYAEAARQVKAQMLNARVLGPVRVLDSEVRDMLKQKHTTLKVEYAAVEPPVEPTEEEIEETYELRSDSYMSPEQRKVVAARIPIKGGKPKEIEEVAKQARAEGADFVALAKEHSEGALKASGGDLGWVAPGEDVPAHRAPVLELGVGAVSDAIEGPAGWHVYKVEEERKNEETGDREVRVRQIFMKPEELPEEQLEERRNKAQALMALAEKTGDVAQAAEAAPEAEVIETGFFGRTGVVEDVPTGDARPLQRAAFGDRTEDGFSVAEGDVFGVVEGRDHLYVGQVAEVKPGEREPLEEVREQVVRDTIQRIKNTEAYQERVEQFVQEIQAQAESVEQIAEDWPELEAEVGESKELSLNEPFAFEPGQPLWRVESVFAAAGQGGPGTFAGPIQSAIGKTYFVEVIERNTPGEETLEAKLEEEGEETRDQLMRFKERQRLQDYLTDLRQQAIARDEVQYDWERIETMYKPIEEVAEEEEA